MATQNEERLQGLAQLLVQDELLDKTNALSYQRLAIDSKLNLQQFLINKNILSAEKIAWTIAKGFGLPFLDLDAIDTQAMPLALVDEKLIKRHQVLPLLVHGNHLFIGTDDPSRHGALKEIQFNTGLLVSAIVVETDKLFEFIEALSNEKDSEGLSNYFDEGGGNELEGVEISSEEEANDSDITGSSDDAPVVKFINRIIVEAIKKGASDIHFEPYEREYRIRYRHDGLLTEVASPPVILANRISARIKVMSSLDISERRVPQDGRFKMRLSRNKAIDFRVSTCPTVGGEKVVMRILDPSATRLGVEALGFTSLQKVNFTKAIDKPQGMILVTGPTGSGKTVTLYTALNVLNTIERNISTAEDPVEIKVPGINQVNINIKAGLTFSGALRSFLRQDPDVIMVGEIRDLETAEIGVKAAQTGHLVLSTIHTNSAAETLTRLLNMGVPSYNIASSITLIVAQRLARRLCEHCKTVLEEITPANLIELGFSEAQAKDAKIYKPVGCEQCTNGFRGRVALFEVMPMTKTIGELIMRGGNSIDILTQAQKDGMLTIYQSGLIKILEGITCIEEVNRVTVE